MVIKTFKNFITKDKELVWVLFEEEYLENKFVDSCLEEMKEYYSEDYDQIHIEFPDRDICYVYLGTLTNPVITKILYQERNQEHEGLI